MSRIQASVGLVTGIPIQQTVDQLIAVAATPRNLLINRTSSLQRQQTAINSLSSLILGVQFEINKFQVTDLFASKEIASSNVDALTASLVEGATPPAGSYTFTPVQTATSNQFVSSQFGGNASPTGVGSFTFQTGGFVDEGLELSRLNGGQGVARGDIRITDRSGESSVINLRFAKSVDDVIEAINADTTINVTASADGDSFTLTDNTGQTVSNLIVQEVNNGTTAADLGIGSINAASATASGTDVVSLFSNLRLTELNDGNGVQLRSGNDLAVSLRDGSTLDVDLGSAQTLSDAVDALNAVDPAKFTATISASGDRLEVTDLTVGGGTFEVTSVSGGSVAEDLGLTEIASGGTISSRRLLAGLKTSLVNSLNGGAGYSSLGRFH